MNAIAKFARILVAIIFGLVALAAIGCIFAWQQARRSLPQLEGKLTVDGLAQPVTLTRDAAGVPTIRALNQKDAVWALGFVHGQDRFFQMDLQRRAAAGELAELVGRAALAGDIQNRRHAFRAQAHQVIARLPERQRRLVERYCDGVNAGLATLRAKPIEYRLLRETPTPWAPDDVALCLYAMSLQLQDARGMRQYALAALHDLGDPLFAFLAPKGSPWDAALDDSRFPVPAVPGPDAIDLPSSPLEVKRYDPLLLFASLSSGTISARAASNSFAVAGKHTAEGAPILAGDMHLQLRLPNTWYRADIRWRTDSGTDGERRLIGLTLPGIPFLIAGSNGQIAWNFTNTLIDTAELIEVLPDKIDPRRYFINTDTSAELEQREETVQVKGGEATVVRTDWTKWGPVVARSRHELLALRWTIDDAEAVNFNLWDMDEITNVQSGIALAKTCGIPPLNILIVDRAGHIGWTICGFLPRHEGWDNRLPVSLINHQDKSHDYLPPEQIPEIIDPPSGLLWTANNRLVGGETLARIGYGPYDFGARATQIRDDLTRLEHATANDLLAISLDDRALFLSRWRTLLLKTLDFSAVTDHPSRAQFRKLVENWGGRASVDSVGYYLVAEWRRRVSTMVFEPIVWACKRKYPEFDISTLDLEVPLWSLLQSRPHNWLNPRFNSWDELMIRAVDDVLAGADKAHVSLATFTWGSRNRANIAHPFAGLLPSGLRGLLQVPTAPLPGDDNMPRVQHPAFGASERLIVSPGREAAGIFEMPGGQSGNPLSPFWNAGHHDWLSGVPSALIPGRALYTLELSPRDSLAVHR